MLLAEDHGSTGIAASRFTAFRTRSLVAQMPVARFARSMSSHSSSVTRMTRRLGSVFFRGPSRVFAIASTLPKTRAVRHKVPQRAEAGATSCRLFRRGLRRSGAMRHVTRMAKTAAEILNDGDLTTLSQVMKQCRVGDLLLGGGARLVKEVLPVSSNSATPTYSVARLLSAKVSGGSTGNGEKMCMLPGDAAMREYAETAAVSSAAATPAFAVTRLLHAKTVGTGAAGEKSCQKNGATPAAGECAPNAGGTSVTFNAETTGAGTVGLVYLTDGGVCTPNAGGTSLAFKASEVSGASAVVTVVYLTTDPPKNADGVAATALSEAITGLY